ncbi:MAG: alpha/beta fold hydrolase [Elusimicrobiota bacterium]|nr:MAG: alpha/beta fold hydrolase [Elusimicrobiota bacterium]
MIKAVLLVAGLSLGAAAAPAPVKPAAAKPAAGPSLPGEPVELKTVDGWTLKATFAPSVPGKMTLLLLHGTGQRKEDWKRLAFPLTRAGYGVLAVDLRGHGDSRTAPSGEEITYKKLKATPAQNDFADMSRDAEAAVAWLAGQGVPEDSIGLIGAEVGGSIAIRYAATHSKVPLVVMLSPGMRWQEVLTPNALRALKRAIPTPVLMVYSEADKRSSKEVPILYAFAKAAVGPRHVTLVSVPQERGTRMFRAQRHLVGQVIDWLGDPIQPEGVELSTAPLQGGTTSSFMRREIQDKTLIDDTGTPAPALGPADDADD